MKISKLDRRITIIEDVNREQNITDDNGAPIENWNTWETVWANKKGLSGHVFYAAAAVNAETDVVFTIRYVKHVRTDMRITDSEGTYSIKAIIDKEGTKRYLTITASIITTG